jgi:hypothetical protein
MANRVGISFTELHFFIGVIVLTLIALLAFFWGLWVIALGWWMDLPGYHVVIFGTSAFWLSLLLLKAVRKFV